jgi:hypothetical protein
MKRMFACLSLGVLMCACGPRIELQVQSQPCGSLADEFRNGFLAITAMGCVAERMRAWDRTELLAATGRRFIVPLQGEAPATSQPRAPARYFMLGVAVLDVHYKNGEGFLGEPWPAEALAELCGTDLRRTIGEPCLNGDPGPPMSLRFYLSEAPQPADKIICLDLTAYLEPDERVDIICTSAEEIATAGLCFPSKER